MVPVLAVQDLEAARHLLASHFGFVDLGAWRMALGTQEIALCDLASPPPLADLPLDHLALSVADADAADARLIAAGATRAAAFTPEGPRTIPEFWQAGARFTFFEAPEGAPLEFCADLGAPKTAGGHDHYGLRCADLGAMAARLQQRGAVILAEHRLPGGTAPVQVMFLALGSEIFELFNEPESAPRGAGGWIGFLA